MRSPEPRPQPCVELGVFAGFSGSNHSAAPPAVRTLEQNVVQACGGNANKPSKRYQNGTHVIFVVDGNCQIRRGLEGSTGSVRKRQVADKTAGGCRVTWRVRPASPDRASCLYALRNHSGSLFGTAQPRKLRVQNVDGCSGGFSCFHARRNGCRGCRRKGAAGSLVATVGSPAASTQAAQLLWRLVEQNVGELGHGVLPTPHSLALVSKQSKSKVVVERAGSPPIVSSAAPAGGRAPWRAGTPGNRSVATDFAAGAGIAGSNQAGRSSHRKNFSVITLAASPTASFSGRLRLPTRSR